jgi:hypothetical protein
LPPGHTTGSCGMTADASAPNVHQVTRSGTQGHGYQPMGFQGKALSPTVPGHQEQAAHAIPSSCSPRTPSQHLPHSQPSCRLHQSGTDKLFCKWGQEALDYEWTPSTGPFLPVHNPRPHPQDSQEPSSTPQGVGSRISGKQFTCKVPSITLLPTSYPTALC